MALDFEIFCKSTLGEEYSPSCFGTTLEKFIQGSGDPTYLDWLVNAWGWTLSVAGLGLVIAMAIGILIGTLRTLPASTLVQKGVVLFANAWVELFRNIPVLVQVFLWYHVIPVLVPVLKGLPSYILVSIALGFFTSARIAEQVKAGIQSLPKGQRFAAMALGLTTAQSYRYVILPMALRIVIPPLTSESMNIVKNSSVAFAVSVSELTLFAMQSQEETSRGIEMYLAVTILYAITALSVNRVMVFIEKRSRVPGFISPASTGGH
jgi:glutamate/aspartate transport system permease protein